MTNTDKHTLPIGVFDSGVGGLTVVKEIFHNLPNEKIIYFGDTARVPYGNKSAGTVIRYSKQIASFLVSQNVKTIVIACNTASALALDALQETVDIPVIGVVEPGSIAAVKATMNNRIGVIGTSGTIKSRLYEKYIRELNKDAVIIGKACPLFVSLVEEGMIDDPVTIEMIHRYLDQLVSGADIDTLVLGCTHYPLLRKVIARELEKTEDAGNGRPVHLVNPAYETSLALKDLLEKNDLLNDAPISPADHKYYVSDDVESFRHFAKDITGLEITFAEQMILG